MVKVFLISEKIKPEMLQYDNKDYNKIYFHPFDIVSYLPLLTKLYANALAFRYNFGEMSLC